MRNSELWNKILKIVADELYITCEELIIRKKQCNKDYLHITNNYALLTLLYLLDNL